MRFQVKVADIVAAEQAVLSGVNPGLFKLIKASGKITPQLDAHLRQQLSGIAMPGAK